MNGFFYKLRERIWGYPKYIFGEKNSLASSLFVSYMRLRPFSHIISLAIIFIIIGTVLLFYPQKTLSLNNKTLIEGVVLGKDSGLNSINPLLATNQQIEKDFISLIYQGLIKVNLLGEPQPLLAKSWEQLDKEGKDYRFYLRDDVYWHDGEKFSANDVLRTFELIKSLDENSSSYVKAVKEMQVSKIDDYTIEIVVDNVRPSLFEDISFGIMPSHLLEGVSSSTFSQDPINKKPIGSGPYKYVSYKNNKVVFEANTDYFQGTPKIKKLIFVFYDDFQSAIEALKTGQIHLLADASTLAKEEIDGWNDISPVQSAPLYRRYWALFFNLKEGGNQILKDKTVRQAISLGVDRQEIIKSIISAGVEAMGPINNKSWAYAGDIKRYTYNLDEAKKLLEDNGWIIEEGTNVRTKEGVRLEFTMSYLDQYDKQIIAEIIKANLVEIGVVVNLDPVDSEVLNNTLVSTRNFETVLYGVETTVDPDHIRLWHSDAITPPGLNIASYKSEKTLSVIIKGETKEIGVIDATLQNGRSSLDKEERIGDPGQPGYNRFQEVLMEDCPVVFLYHPVFNYLVNSRVKGIDLSNITSPEERFLNIVDWEIQI